ncbi:hypothetical protein JYT20_00780 [Rhodothermus sp. AH-315-K08]|nr:hypothetical protein [Rhodothermus sp. AH-315-K08]
MKDLVLKINRSIAQHPESLDRAIENALREDSYRISLFKKDCIRNRQDPRAQLKRILAIYKRQTV